MKIYRYMSDTEFEVMMYAIRTDTPMVSDSTFKDKGYHTDSVGFCFMPEKIPYPMKPKEYIEFLAGIVSQIGYLVEFEVKNEAILQESYGEYSVPFRWAKDWFDTFQCPEYCTVTYSPVRDLIPVRYCTYNYYGETSSWHTIK